MAEFAYNNAKHASTGYTPFELNCGYYPHVSYEEDLDPRSRSKAADKLADDMQKELSAQIWRAKSLSAGPLRLRTWILLLLNLMSQYARLIVLLSLGHKGLHTICYYMLSAQSPFCPKDHGSQFPRSGHHATRKTKGMANLSLPNLVRIRA